MRPLPLPSRKQLWKEIQKVIVTVDAAMCKTKVSKEGEGEFYNVVRQGRGIPSVPLVILGIEDNGDAS